jgi:hypothetical protein
MFVYAPSSRNTAALLYRMGLSRKRIGRLTRTSTRTVSRWLRTDPRFPRRILWDQILTPDLWSSYSYLLGIYLGDGHIAGHRRGVYCLSVHLDAAYPQIIGEVFRAMRRVMPNNRANVVRHHRWNSVRVTCYSKAWPALFPQHGVGRKHDRRIRLADWQQTITASYPKELIRGLIHSDGCRFVARQRRLGRIYCYSRYSFSNKSRDIMRIFCDHLDLLGIHWTLTDPEQAQIARRESVQMLDAFVGAKA